MTDGYLWFEGLPFSVVGYSYEVLKEACAQFVIKDEDTVLVTYPKSGKETGQGPSMGKAMAVFFAYSAEGWHVLYLPASPAWGGRVVPQATSIQTSAEWCNAEQGSSKLLEGDMGVNPKQIEAFVCGCLAEVGGKA